MPWGGTWKSSTATFLVLLLGVILTQSGIIEHFLYGQFKNDLSGHKTLHFRDLIILTMLPIRLCRDRS